MHFAKGCTYIFASSTTQIKYYMYVMFIYTTEKYTHISKYYLHRYTHKSTYKPICIE